MDRFVYDVTKRPKSVVPDFYSVLTMSTPIQRTWAIDERHEHIQRPEGSAIVVIVPGVELCPLTGVHSSARDLYTALLTVTAKASYPLYTRPVMEVLTLLNGDGSVEVEDRRYHLKPLDSLSIPSRLPRRIVNLSSNQPLTFHMALAAEVAEQAWVNGRFTAVDQRAAATGHAGAEQIRRNDPTARFELAPSAHFQDLFSGVSFGQGMCGGYGLFEPGARLPCHRHEFDESITIVQGKATCIVEGRRHELSDHSTALIPQGLCHYFINLTLEPMAMIWVYAGVSPNRIVMDETFCHPERGRRSRL